MKIVIFLLLFLTPSALACSPSTGPTQSPGTDSPQTQGTSSATASSTGTTVSSGTTVTTTSGCADEAQANYAKMSNKCKLGNRKEYLIVDPKACIQAKINPCDCTQNLYCAYLQKSNSGNSFTQHQTPLVYDCKPLPCSCLQEIGKSGNCAKGGADGGGGYGKNGKLQVQKVQKKLFQLQKVQKKRAKHA